MTHCSQAIARCTIFCGLLSTAVLLPLGSHAQPTRSAMGRSVEAYGGTNRPPAVVVRLDTSYAFAAKAKFLGVKSGDSDAFNLGLNLSTSFRLGERWTLPLGLTSQNTFLDGVAGVPIPDGIHTLSLTTGLGYRLNDNWMLSGMFSPTLYKFSDIGGNDFGFSGGVTALWRYDDSLTLAFGLIIAPDSDLKAIPAIGATWRINQEWELRAIYPQPRLLYSPDEQWSFYLGANITSPTFRTSDTLGSSIGRPEYNDALGTYREIGLGIGLSHRFNSQLRAEAELGYCVSRQIDYTRVDEKVKFDPAPYLRLGVNWNF